MTKTQLAAACKVSVVTIGSWLSKGLPHSTGKDGHYQFDLKAVQAWRKHNLIARPTPRQPAAPSYSEARARKETALAGLRELQLSQRRGELIEKALIRTQTFATWRRVRDNLINLPPRLAGIFAAETDQHRIFDMLMREILQTLEGICDDTTGTTTTKSPRT